MNIARFVNGNFEILYHELCIYKEFDVLRTGSNYPFETLIKYIYFLVDPKSYTIKNGLTRVEAEKYAAKNAGLPINYKPDAKVTEAIHRWEELSYDSLNVTCKELRKLLGKTPVLVSKMNDQLSTLLASDTLSPEDSASIVKTIKTAFDLSNDSTKYIEIITELENKIKIQEEKTITIARGGTIVSQSMKRNNPVDLAPINDGASNLD